MNHHHKFQALANQVTQRRMEHLEELRRVTEMEGLDILEGGQRRPKVEQIPFTFEELSPSLEVFQTFDEKGREIEWSFYTSGGEFLLQFGFGLASRNYEIHSLHPELFLARPEMQSYLEAINRRLASGYPSLELVMKGGQPLVRGKE